MSNNESNTSDFSITGDALPHLKPGKYQVAYDSYETQKLFNGRAHKLIVWFRVITEGEFYGILIPRYYNIKIRGKAGKNGRFSVGRKTEFLREYTLLFGMPSRCDRISMNPFKKVIIDVCVCDVEKNVLLRKIPKCMQYSKIDELLKVKTL